MPKVLERILDYLRQKRDFDATGYWFSYVERRLQERLTAVECKHYDEYLRHIQAHSDEIEQLVNALTINFSGFFRDPLTFEYIGAKILPRMLYRKRQAGDRTFSVWSAGCSTGEEAYAIAILIHELFKQESFKLNLNIFATDIDRSVLNKGTKSYLFL